MVPMAISRYFAIHCGHGLTIPSESICGLRGPVWGWRLTSFAALGAPSGLGGRAARLHLAPTPEPVAASVHEQPTTVHPENPGIPNRLEIHTMWADGSKIARRTNDTWDHQNPAWLVRP